MRISDWSSDVCSSDLAVLGANYPGSKWYKRAYELMQKHAPAAGGGQPGMEIRAELAEAAAIFVHAEARRRGESGPIGPSIFSNQASSPSQQEKSRFAASAISRRLRVSA